MAAEPRDRRAKLRDDGVLNGIDFVEVVDAAQTRLRVHFLAAAPAVAGEVARATITGGDRIPTVAVHELTPASWGVDADGRPTLDLVVDAPGDFSTYLLTLVPADPLHPVLDRYFDHVEFSFKAGCPSTLDCEPPPHECPPGDRTAPPIDYLAKDFESFRRALLEFSALRYPAWQERSEADFGVMFAEALASIADDLSYQQDRIAAEGWLETATERRSLVRLARLVDYEPRVATAAHVVLQFTMDTAGAIPPGTLVAALAPDGETVEFETGPGIADRAAAPVEVDPAWNRLEPWWFDDAERCLAQGSTVMWIKRPAVPLRRGQRLLIETAGASTADPPTRWFVVLEADGADEVDAVFGTDLTRLTWRLDDALAVDHDLTRTTLAANLVPATHGRRRIERFSVGEPVPPVAGVGRAVRRTGANATPQFLYPLREAPLAWLARPEPDEEPWPELVLVEVGRGADRWDWQRSLLRARAFDRWFTLDPMAYRALDRDRAYFDYDGDAGHTIRFGDGALGAIPERGMTFEVTYRIGGGSAGNVAAGALTRIDPVTRAALGIASVTNPLAATGGRDAEPAAQVRELAPQKFRARPLRVVRTEDYEAAAASLGFVQRAGTRFRYTGSWLSAFTSVDPRGTPVLSDERTRTVTELLDRRRLAGYESFVLPPRFASLDLRIEVCVRPDAFRSDVHVAVLAALDARVHLDGTTGFFHPDHFTFGVPLERSALEAAIQDVHGVDGVIGISYRRRAHTAGFVAMPDAVEIAADEIIRVDNDPNRPERGSLRLELRGGK